MRVYLDHNATTPLRAEARVAMLAAMDVVGNPSSVHAEGRAAKALVERARAQVATALACDPAEVVFTSGATEAINLVFAQPWDEAACSPLEHDAVLRQTYALHDDPHTGAPLIGRDGVFNGALVSGFGFYAQRAKRGEPGFGRAARGLFALTAANAETGVLQPLHPVFAEFAGEMEVSHRFCDATQAFGKVPFSYRDTPCEYASVSAHKIGGPKGVGALVVKQGVDISAGLKGGGQEMGRRSGTENVIGIAGFGAAAEAAAHDVAAGHWEAVAEKRDLMESALEAASNTTILVGKDAPRLPNTSCLVTAGWKGETQVMQMDLAGFAISAGSACSSGKVKASTVLQAMGYDESEASSAIRVSLGLETTQDDVLRFADAWAAKLKKHEARAA
ncbi:cysteine desulfurase family protein [Sulfitobacter aestuariivivens]|uniref:Cysteine desulfurase n=1 Tax=Sulfitobacter aestuariivivens TaxID=2766981 RepID=A0A927D5P6_9RHOB|nr:aminotransferase class V-fold PLP-dependent enzyme [Sulfitobacter aestuariivivens]MBD3663286.1 aminotransferase class V-fold PLP-dependent enzyme [Sulfitobacter aestuariivivens]